MHTFIPVQNSSTDFLAW